MIRAEKAKRAARKGQNIGDGSELFGDWALHQPKAAWLAYMLMDSTDWHHLPDTGGWFDQDELLMEDLATLTTMAGYVRAQIDANEADKGDHA